MTLHRIDDVIMVHGKNEYHAFAPGQRADGFNRLSDLARRATVEIIDHYHYSSVGFTEIDFNLVEHTVGNLRLLQSHARLFGDLLGLVVFGIIGGPGEGRGFEKFPHSGVHVHFEERKIEADVGVVGYHHRKAFQRCAGFGQG